MRCNLTKPQLEVCLSCWWSTGNADHSGTEDLADLLASIGKISLYLLFQGGAALVLAQVETGGPLGHQP